MPAMTPERILYRRQLRACRHARDLSLQTARFVRRYRLGDVLPCVQAAWLNHGAVMAMLRLGEPK